MDFVIFLDSIAFASRVFVVYGFLKSLIYFRAYCYFGVVLCFRLYYLFLG